MIPALFLPPVKKGNNVQVELASAKIVENNGRFKAIITIPQDKRVEFEKLPQREQDNLKKNAVLCALDQTDFHEKYHAEVRMGRVKVHVRFN